ncbi:predicted protein [Naegleria gruberi]|uniref:Predicted protein n=1 Tax=Naegleria gruberi TaxID=5762 RepID=D2V250_NAEGR|nr:uncharacterized protein NAEGRDRAFT_62879 [Naegleria gruberi]EFC48992.1 predicted protein [Naegleria gruberi]|eukprot:XP_002681736.1 predicted protein [Naegleria gruberi strain NEG-M]
MSQQLVFSDHFIHDLYGKHSKIDEKLEFTPLGKLHYIQLLLNNQIVESEEEASSSPQTIGINRDEKHLIILLHGSFQTCHTFDDFVEEFYNYYQKEENNSLQRHSLNNRFRFVSVDLRGHGDSAHTPNQYSMDGFVADLILFVVRYLEKESFDRVSFVGMSLGGIILMNALLTDRKSTLSLSGGINSETLSRFEKILANHLHSISLIDISPDQIPVHSIIPQGTQSVSQQVKSTQTFNTFEEFLAWAQKYNPRRSVENLTTRLKYSLKCNPETNLWTWKYDTTFSIDNMAANTERNLREELWKALETKQDYQNVKVSIVRGADSSVTTREQLERLFNLLCKNYECNFIEISKAGHSVLGDNPKEYIENYFAQVFIPQKRSKH